MGRPLVDPTELIDPCVTCVFMTDMNIKELKALLLEVEGQPLCLVEQCDQEGWPYPASGHARTGRPDAHVPPTDYLGIYCKPDCP